MAKDEIADRGRERDRADELNRWWDALVLGGAVDPDERPPVASAGADPALAVALRRLHALDDAPLPESAFGARLWQGLVAPVPAREEPASSLVEASNRRVAPPLRVVHPLGGGALGRMAAAAIVLAVLGGSLGGRGLIPTLTGGSPTVSAHEVSPTVVATVIADASSFAPPTPKPGFSLPGAGLIVATAIASADAGWGGRSDR